MNEGYINNQLNKEEKICASASSEVYDAMNAELKKEQNKKLFTAEEGHYLSELIKHEMTSISTRYMIDFFTELKRKIAKNSETLQFDVDNNAKGCNNGKR